MKLAGTLLAILLAGLGAASAQSIGIEDQGKTTATPQLINYSGNLTDVGGNPIAAPIGVTFVLFNEPQGGEVIWMETQTVQPDKTGHFSVVLGSASQGLPANLFTTNESRWLELQITGQVPQPRVLMVAVPYAFKAGNAETLAGLPVSAFVLAGNQNAEGEVNASPTHSEANLLVPIVHAPSLRTGNISLNAPASDFMVTGSPVIGSGTLGLNWTVLPTSAGVGNSIVKRDTSGNFTANSVGLTGDLNVNGYSYFLNPLTAMNSLIVGNNTTQGLQIFTSGAGADLESIGVPLTFNWLTGNTSAFRNSVGIGTDAPQAKLNLNVGGTASSDDLLIGNNSTKGLRLRDTGIGVDLESIGVPLYVNYVTNQNTVINPNGGSVFIGENGSNTNAALYVGARTLPVNGSGPEYVSALFSNDVLFYGNIYAYGTKDFRIDHPLDPTNKYLDHAAIESSEVLNLYSGNVVLDGNGAGEVDFPDWFASINTDFRYQLTAIGAPAAGLYVAKEIDGNSFTIAGGKPGSKVSWQVTARRNDAYMQAHPFVVERGKPPSERGHYSKPELYPQSAAK